MAGGIKSGLQAPIQTPNHDQLVTKPTTQQPTQGCTVDSCRSNDVTKPPTPQLLRAICFDIAKPDAQIVPTPPPANNWSTRPRDPVLMELGNIEIGSKIQFISLTDKPDASFDDAKDVRELDFTGYDVGARRGTVVLNENEMRDKNFQPGERIVLRTVDKNGNHSDGIFVHLDPNGWARNTIRQNNDAGQPVDLQGANLRFADGMMGIQGATGKMKEILGVTVRDQDAPLLIEKNVKLATFKYSNDEMKVAADLAGGASRNWIYSIMRRTEFTIDEAKQMMVRSDVPPETKAMFDKLLANDSAMFKRFVSAANPLRPVTDPQNHRIGDSQTSAVSNSGGRQVYLQLDQAVEPGVQFSLQNSRTGDNFAGSVAVDSRLAVVALNNVQDGDPMILTFRDAAGNQGKPYALEYSADCKDGKAGYNPLSIRFGGAKIPAKDVG